jgi:hypothetical protein
VQVIGLNRQFVEWTKSEAPDPYLRSRLGLSDGALGWNDLLVKRRVVILAEAGSGKSVEMAERARLQTEAGQFAFYATVAGVGRRGLDSALDSKNRTRLAAWRASNQDGWFFIDSVDEGKLIDIGLDDVIPRLADGIEGADALTEISFRTIRVADDRNRTNGQVYQPDERGSRAIRPQRCL